METITSEDRSILHTPILKIYSTSACDCKVANFIQTHLRYEPCGDRLGIPPIPQPVIYWTSHQTRLLKEVIARSQRLLKRFDAILRRDPQAVGRCHAGMRRRYAGLGGYLIAKRSQSLNAAVGSAARRGPRPAPNDCTGKSLPEPSHESRRSRQSTRGPSQGNLLIEAAFLALVCLVNFSTRLVYLLCSALIASARFGRRFSTHKVLHESNIAF
jgi:hypothetical protein